MAWCTESGAAAVPRALHFHTVMCASWLYSARALCPGEAPAPQSFVGRHSPWLQAGQGLMVQGTTGLSLTVTLDKGWSDRTRGSGFKLNKDRVRWDILEKLFPVR